MTKKRIALITLWLATFITALNLLHSFAITEKPLYERLLTTVVIAFTGGGIGAVIGMVIGGIGVALMGTAVGILGWVAFGLSGLILGAASGSIYTIIQNPAMYDFHISRLLVVIGVSAAISFGVTMIIDKIMQKVRGLPAAPEPSTGHVQVEGD